MSGETIATPVAKAILASCHGRGNRAQCPVCARRGGDTGHDHLSVSERDGKVLVKCFAGCEQAAVIDALKGLGAWPDRVTTGGRKYYQREWSQRQARATAIADRVSHWLRGLILTLEAEAAEAGSVDDWDRLEPVARTLFRLNTANEDELIAWYRRDQNAADFEVVGRRNSDETVAIAEEVVAIIAAAQRTELQS